MITLMVLIAVRPPDKLAPRLLSPGTSADDFSGAAGAADAFAAVWAAVQPLRGQLVPRCAAI